MRTILVIEDDAEYRHVLGETLRQNGWHVLQADNGDDGVELAETHRPQIVLCDVLMARGNGFQVCRALRQLESLAHTKIVMISGMDFESDRQTALAAGADEYLTKPVAPSQLIVLLSRLAGDGESPAPPPIRNSAGSAYFRIKFWGVRGSIPTPGPGTVYYGGNTSCVEVRAEGQILILDAGTGLRGLGRELVAEFGDQPLDLTLLLTHTHWDHIQGLPFFLPVYQPRNRLRILGYEGARLGLENVLSSQMESPFFPIGLSDVPANVRIEELKELEFYLGPIRVQAWFAYHPGVCVGYRLHAAGRSLAFFPDNELRPEPKEGESVSENTTAEARQFARDENRKLCDFLRGTDVLIMDTQYDRVEYQEHLGWGHGCLDEVVAVAMQADVKHLFLFHHDPDHDDAKISDMTNHARQLVASRNGTLAVDAAREGLTVDLPAFKA